MLRRNHPLDNITSLRTNQVLQYKTQSILQTARGLDSLTSSPCDDWSDSLRPPLRVALKGLRTASKNIHEDLCVQRTQSELEQKFVGFAVKTWRGQLGFKVFGDSKAFKLITSFFHENRKVSETIFLDNNF